MLDKFKKYFKQPEGEKEAEMVDESTQPDLAAQLASALDTLASQGEALEAVTKQLAVLSAQSKLDKAALEASETVKAQLVKDAADKRLKARTEAVEAAIGTSKSAGVLAATETLDDAQFEAIVSAMAASFDEESKSVMFTEKGVAAEAKVPEEQDQVTRLASMIAEQFPNT